MQQFVARENIRRLQVQLETCTDQEQRAVLNELLKEELGKLEGIKTSRIGLLN